MIQYVYFKQLHQEIEPVIDQMLEAYVTIQDSFWQDQDKIYVFYPQVLDMYAIIRDMMSETLTSIVAYMSYPIDALQLTSHIQLMKDVTAKKNMFHKGLITDHDLLLAYKDTAYGPMKKFILKKYVDQPFMLDSVLMYLNHNQNMSQAAKELFVHRNTLIGRLDKFFEVTGFDVKTFKDAYLIYSLLTQ
ncbi:MAG: helix-turn-helix domain-containing protein [Acholeplasmataceae bacterium]